MTMTIETDIAPAMAACESTADISPATEAAAGARRCRGLLRRMTMPWARGHYSPVGVVEREGAAPETAPLPRAQDDCGEEKPRRRGWMRRLVVPGERAQRRWRWKDLAGGGASRLARSLRWKRLSGISVGLSGRGWASALLDAVAFRVMYVAEAVVLGLALSCFFCCCGCQI